MFAVTELSLPFKTHWQVRAVIIQVFVYRENLTALPMHTFMTFTLLCLTNDPYHMFRS